MKKSIVVMLLLAVFMSCGFSSVPNTFAQEVSTSAVSAEELWAYESFTYNGETGIAVTEYKGDKTDIFIPSRINNLPVLKLGDNLFKNKTGINSVTLGDGIKVIGNGAFENSTDLVCIVTSSDLIEIEANAFSGCTAFNSVVLYNTVTKIGENAFANCQKLKIYGETGSYAETYATANNLTFIPISEDAEPEIAEKDGIIYYILNGEAIAVSADASITEAVIPTAVNDYPVTELKETFKNCSKLTTVSLPEGLKTIGENAFYYCSKLTNVTIPNSVTSIGKYAFYYCSSLTSITLPNSVTSIGNMTFYACSSLTSVTIPNSVTSIGSCAFSDCSSLTSITIPDGITKIDSCAFSHCSSLTSITIPNSVTSIGYGAFSCCTNLTSITIPESVTSIDSHTFSGCSSLTSVTIPNSVTSIGYDAFSDCTNLISVTIPKSVKSLSTSSFPTNTILCVYENSYAHTFAEKNGLLYFVIQDGENPEIYNEDGIIYYILNGEAVAVSADTSITEAVIPTAVNNYPVTELRETFKNCSQLTTVSLPEGLKTIGDNAFSDCSSLTSITIPDSVTSIGNSAFSFCTSLTSVTIGNGVTSIGDNTFSVCTSLTSIIIPDSVTNIGNSAFSFCTSLTSVTIGNGVTSIDSHTFSSCTSLTSVTIPNSVTSIGYYAFYYCSSLTSVTIPDSVTSIGSYAFYYCTSLTSVTIPDSVTSIGSYAFYYCTSLTSVTIPESVKSLSTDSFPTNTILCVYENSYAHTFAEKNGLLYFVIHKTANPEIEYGMGISGKATYTGGDVLANASVDILYDDGTVKESVKTDENGEYAFTYAEVGRYTIRVTDENGLTGSGQVSVKRMNAFEVFLAGETDITVKNAFTVSGTAPSGAAITLGDTDGKVITTVSADENGRFEIANVSGGTYIVKAENEKGSAVREITVYNSDVDMGAVEIFENDEYGSITGTVFVEDREHNHHKKIWIQVTIYNEDGNAVSQTKTDENGGYNFGGLPLGEYAIVAETAEMRRDPMHDFDRSYTMTGYAYVNIEEAKEYTADDIILTEENNSIAEISGKVTAQGENPACEVILRNVFRHEIARCETGSNGKYTFKNVRDGLYFVFAVTKNNGMGFTVVTVRQGRVYGKTDIYVFKPEKIKEHENIMNSIPHCADRNDANRYREEIRKEKEFYDGLSEKDKKQLSYDYIERLNKLCEWLADCSYEENGGKIHHGGMIVSEDELKNEDTKIEIVLNVTEREPHKISSEGIKTGEDFIQQNIEDTAGERHLAQYYDITLLKNGQQISNISKQTNSTGKLRITLEIPEEYRGHKNYSFVHMHNGIPTTLVDLDDDPNTVTFEIDKFSTFAMTYSDEELASEPEDAASIRYADGVITVNSDEAATLYIAEYEDGKLKSCVKHDISADEEATFAFDETKTAFLWDKNRAPLCGKFEISK